MIVLKLNDNYDPRMSTIPAALKPLIINSGLDLKWSYSFIIHRAPIGFIILSLRSTGVIAEDTFNWAETLPAYQV